MKLLQCLAVACVLTTTGAVVRSSSAAAFPLRQYYATWHEARGGQYYYRQYYFKPRANYVGYRHHYVIYFPQRPKHYYFYNPYKKVYWGRCPVETNGDGQYSMLAESARRGNLQAIPESAFPAATEMPSVPDSTDGEKLDLPPDDLPPADQTLPSVSNND